MAADRCKITLLEEVPPGPSEFFLTLSSETSVRKMSIVGGNSFTTADSFDSGQLNTGGEIIAYNGKIYYRPISNNNIYRVDIATMLSEASADPSTTAAFVGIAEPEGQLSLISCSSAGSVYWIDLDTLAVPTVGGNTANLGYYGNTLSRTGQIERIMSKMNPNNYPSDTGYVEGVNFKEVGTPDCLVKVYTDRKITPPDPGTQRCFEEQSVDLVNLNTPTEYHNTSYQHVMPNPNQFISIDITGFMTFHEFGSPNVKTGVQLTGAAMNTNRAGQALIGTTLFIIDYSLNKLYQIDDVWNATTSSHVELTNTDGLSFDVNTKIAFEG